MTTGTGDVNVDDVAAAAAANEMYEAIGAIRKTINAINGEVQDVKAKWKGDAQGAFETAAVDWEEEATQLNGILDQMQQQVESGNNAYLAMDQGARDDFARLQGGSGGGGLTSL
ncbi:hypothetical protein BOX37_04005 [Nocardia mangyaensis]|uniref:ESAT-6-like protein n=1 Tax=Nocardia mangyaensis TaxID=2213200 RepID=A0A1J0VMK4_9NOCA|nr:WXG100 family type VII secretion target [Nocardia mangyaensis]APE33267.1 hypothetical protein BOX37_04005 [Nocardia mangyaensis]